MGEVTELVLEGVLCMECGCYVESCDGEAPGFPQLCEDCE